MEEEISALEKDLFDDHQTIGFCHNDVQYGNIMLDEETRSITIIVIYFSPCLEFIFLGIGEMHVYVFFV